MDKAVPDNGPLHTPLSSHSLVTKINRGRPCSPPTGGTTPTRREGGDGSGCPRSKLHARPS
ncbi:hypothetical protein C0Q59_15760 [Streptomyces albidoflavus]|nr:hypothetical protein C0Q59_15760 [Streptomyces albidoflavus]